MALQEKYAELVSTAGTLGITDLQVREQNNVLYIDGTAPNGEAKDKMWEEYNKIDPDYKGGDLVMNVNVGAAAAGEKMKVTTNEGNLNIRKGPGTDQEVVGKAAHGDTVTLLSKANDQWSLIKTEDGVEGYSFNQYLTAE